MVSIRGQSLSRKMLDSLAGARGALLVGTVITLNTRQSPLEAKARPHRERGGEALMSLLLAE